MKFRFPLQKVLDHRKVLEDLAQKDFREAEAAAAAERLKLADMIEALRQAGLRAGMIQDQSPPGAPESLKQIHQYSVLQKIRIEAQRAKVGEAEKLVEAKREILRQAAVDLKIMERLKERRREEFLREQMSQEQKDNDEISVLRYRAKDGG